MIANAPHSSAVFDEDRLYRYRLERWINTPRPTSAALNIIGLNPSTADEDTNDPTIRRCIAFAKSWGFGWLVMTNLFAWRATDPFQLRYQDARGIDLVGPENDHHLLKAAREADKVVAAWGHWGWLLSRDHTVLSMLAAHGVATWAFGLTKNGYPKHPLYLPRGTQPMLWPT